MPSATQLRDHRASIASLTQLAKADLAAIVQQATTADQVQAALLDVVPGLVDAYGSASATLAADWYDELRDQARAAKKFSAIPAAPVPAEQAEALARWAAGPMYGPDASRDTALVKAQGGVQRLVANMDRITIAQSVRHDPAKPRFSRVTSAGSCAFCRMLAGRGAVYRSEETAGGHEYHDHCHCIVAPAWAADDVVPAVLPPAPDVVAEPEFVAKLADNLRSGAMSPEDLRSAAASASPLGQANAEEALRIFTAEQEAAKAVAVAEKAATAAREQVVVRREVPADAFLSSEQYDALTPTSAWSQEKRDAILSSLRETPEGKVLADTLERFQDGGSIARLRTKMEKYLAGEEIDQTSKARAEALINAIRHSPDWAPEKLYRGMTVKGKLENVIAKYEAGGTLDLNLTSFSSDRKVATRFQSMTAKGGTETRVMVELVGDGKKTLPIQNLPKDKRLFREKEWVSAGRYEILEVKKSSGQILLRIQQVEAP